MTTLPEALRLADALEQAYYKNVAGPDLQAAAELRRLHEAHDWQYKMAGDRLRRIEKLESVNQELLEALKALLEADAPDYIKSSIWNKARAAIAKAEGVTMQNSPDSDTYRRGFSEGHALASSRLKHEPLTLEQVSKLVPPDFDIDSKLLLWIVRATERAHNIVEKSI